VRSASSALGLGSPLLVWHVEEHGVELLALRVRDGPHQLEHARRSRIRSRPFSAATIFRVARVSNAAAIAAALAGPIPGCCCSSDPTPSADDVDLTDRLRAAAELVGILARDHVIVAASGYYSFVEAGRWRR